MSFHPTTVADEQRLPATQQCPLAWLTDLVRSPRAERLATISARIASTVPSRPLGAPRARPDSAALAALTASRGSDLPARRRSCRSQRSTSTTAIPAASEVTGQARAITAGAFDTNQDYSPEAAQPLEQPAVAARRGWELLDAEQDLRAESSAAATWTSAWVSTPPVTTSGLYDGQGHPFHG